MSFTVPKEQGAVGHYEFPEPEPLNGKPNPFSRAVKRNIKARIILEGPSGSGKTWTALELGAALGGKVLLGDTEKDSALRYANDFEFDHCPIPAPPDHPLAKYLTDFSVESYLNLLHFATEQGYSTIIIDSASHEWIGRGGILDQVDRLSNASASKNSFAVWGKMTPKHNEWIEGMLAAPMNIIATLRTKTEYILQQEERNGKLISVPKKVGVQPQQRDGLEYEFDIVFKMDMENRMVVDKTRCSVLSQSIYKGKEARAVGKLIKDWCNDGKDSIALSANIHKLVPVVPAYDETPIAETIEEQIAEIGGEQVPQSATEAIELKAKKELVDTCHRGEEYLSKMKVEQFRTEAKLKKFRKEITGAIVLEALDTDALRSYNERLEAIANQLS